MDKVRKCYISGNGANEIGILQDLGYYYFVVRTVRSEQKKQWVCVFDGHLQRMNESGSKNPVWMLLRDEIINNGQFYLHNTAQTPLGNDHSRSVADTLYSLYNQDKRKHCHAQLRNAKPITIRGLESLEEASFFNDNEVFDLTADNLCARGEQSYIHKRGCVIQALNGDTKITCDGEFFLTDNNSGLREILKQINTWDIASGSGALKASTRNGNIPLASIVYGYHMGLFLDGVIVQDSMSAILEYFRKTKLEIDHLTEDQQVNYLWALVPIQKKTNISMGARRTKIKEPFYFYTVNKDGQLLVKCGFETETQNYKKRFVFLEPMGMGGLAYNQCFNEFSEKVRAAGCFMKQRGDGNLLYYWTRPEHINSNENPLTQLLNEPLDSFSSYSEGAFDDMPELDNSKERG